MGVQVCFSIAKANKDPEFTAMLHVPRSAVVLSKHITVMILQLSQLAVAVLCALVSSLVLNPSGNIVGMDANFAFFGLTLIEFAVFNIVFFPMFYRTGYKMALPLACGAGAFILSAVFFEVIIALIQPLNAVLDSLDPSTFIYQIPLLLIGAAVYAAVFYASYRLSVKKFEKVSL